MNRRREDTPRRSHPSGFALLPVLAIIAGGAALALILTESARDAAGSSENRVSLRRGAWQAEGCLQALVATAIRSISEREPAASYAWRTLDSTLLALPPAECAVRVTALGNGLSVNLASHAQLVALLTSATIPAAQADSMADALVDWRDTNDVALPSGAERAWYGGQGRSGPRNAPLSTAEELSLVRGFEDERVPYAWLTAENGRLFVARAPDAVLSAALDLPAAAVADARRQGGGVPKLSVLRAMQPRPPVGPPGGAAGLEFTEDPDGWVVQCTAAFGLPPVPVTVEYLLVRSGSRLALLRRRSWP